MIPILYKATETEFETNGLGRLSDVITCTVTEARNGQYDLEMTYPVTGIHYADIAEERIILARPYDGGRPQPFDISYISKPINGIVTISAQHVSYRLAKLTVAPFFASSPTEAMQKIQRGIIGGSPFTFSTDKVTPGMINQTVPITCRSLLGGVEGSLLDVFGGGEYEFDRFSVRLWEARGNDNGVTIRYGKDLTGLEDALDIGEVYTSIVPYWVKDDVTVIGDRVENEHAGDYAHQKCIPMDFTADFEEAPTKEQLETAARLYMKNNSTWKPTRNVEISFQPLWQTEEYKDTAVLQRIRLCDTVKVVETLRAFARDGIKVITSEYTAKVIKTVFDGLAERYESVETGDARTTLASAVTSNVPTKADMRREQTARKALADKLQKQLAEASGFYTTSVQQPDGSIISYLHDKATLKESMNLVKITANALGMSTDGGKSYPFGFTINGEMIMGIIQAEGVNADWINAGILQSIPDEKGERNFTFDLETGLAEVKNLSIRGKNVADTLANTVVSVEQQFYQSESPTALTGGKWSKTQPTWTSGTYIWTRQYVTYGDGTNAYLPSETGVCITGNTGKDGTNGKDGTPGTNGTNGKDGAPGKDGVNGTDGEDGVGIESIVAEYYTSTSATEPTGGSWSTDMPSVQPEKYIWTRQKITYTDGNVEYAGQYCMTKTVGDIADDKVKKLDDLLSMAEIARRLSNDWKDEGFFIKDGKMYINASMIHTGVLNLALLILAGELGGIKEGYGSTKDGTTTKGLLIWGPNGLDEEGNAIPPYILLTNAGFRIQTAADANLNVSNRTAQMVGNISATGNISASGNVTATGNMDAQKVDANENMYVGKDLSISSPALIVYDNATGGHSLIGYSRTSSANWVGSAKYSLILHCSSLTSDKDLVVSSDRDKKKDIEALEDAGQMTVASDSPQEAPSIDGEPGTGLDLAERYMAFMDGLTPVRFRYKTEADDAPLHIGYIWQDAVEAMTAAGLTRGDMAALGETVDDTGAVARGIAYGELIPLLHLMIRKQEERIAALEAGLEQMKHK